MTAEELAAVLDIPFKFWSCPDCQISCVRWDGKVATCQDCGKMSKDAAKEYSA